MNKIKLLKAITNTNNHSYLDICRELEIKPSGYSYDLIKNTVKENQLDVSHIKKEPWNKGIQYRIANKHITPINDVLVENSNIQSAKLKERLFNNGLKERVCECCGNSEWLGQPIKLELHHVNGNHFDNRLENLQILCPNCHAMTGNYRGKNSSLSQRLKEKKCKPLTEEEIRIRYEEKKELKKLKQRVKEEDRKFQRLEDKICPICGKTFHPRYKEQIYCCFDCVRKSYSKKPSKEQLIDNINNIGYNLTRIGKHYGVSANAVKKWLKSYDLYIKYKYQQDLHNNKE